MWEVWGELDGKVTTSRPFLNVKLTLVISTAGGRWGTRVWIPPPLLQTTIARVRMIFFFTLKSQLLLSITPLRLREMNLAKS